LLCFEIFVDLVQFEIKINKMKFFLNYLPLVFASFFLLFVIVQYNDPDPLVWMLIYGFVSIICVLAFLKKLNKNVLLVVMPLYLGGSVYLWPGTYEGISMSMGYKPHIELARESLGLLICFLAMIYLYFYTKNQKVSN
jgi:predicted neutral ceramidase superfamily lipid hydrolase